MGAQPKSGNDYFEVSCRSKIDHIEVSFHAVTEMIAGSQSCTCVARRVLILVFYHYSFAIDYFWFHLRNQNFPVSCQLHGIFTVVFDCD
jgi:hypothetical protein